MHGRNKPVTKKEEDDLKRQKLFAEEYMKTGNATQSVITVYGTENLNTASRMGMELRKRPIVQSYISEAVGELDITPYFVLNGIKKIATEGANDTVRLSAFKELARMMDMDTKKKVNFNIDLNEEQASRILGLE